MPLSGGVDGQIRDLPCDVGGQASALRIAGIRAGSMVNDRGARRSRRRRCARRTLDEDFVLGLEALDLALEVLYVRLAVGPSLAAICVVAR